ncbi:competence type IV pilus minor pilin ComGD [Domibacillus indicus]|uniref:competence type IV pilus minor pilin ComGD n=1 Tax=Domibacillus indicus TaxID=1437523 RepID=UPI000617FE8D|nr:competence type IV pilus minor pilin ComGD [Domibacillus indicus]
MVHKEKGFTLLEMMIVLTIFTACLGAALIPLRSIAKDVSDQQFFQQVERDLFFAQTYAVTKNVNVFVHFFEDGAHSYHIYTYEQSRKTITKRDIPKRFMVDERSLSNVTFLRSGTTSRFGTVYFTAEGKSTKLIFLIGRGRFYFTEE